MGLITVMCTFSQYLMDNYFNVHLHKPCDKYLKGSYMLYIYATTSHINSSLQENTSFLLQ